MPGEFVQVPAGEGGEGGEGGVGGAGEHLAGSGPCTTVPETRRFSMLKVELPKSPLPPQFPLGTQPTH